MTTINEIQKDLKAVYHKIADGKDLLHCGYQIDNHEEEAIETGHIETATVTIGNGVRINVRREWAGFLEGPDEVENFELIDESINLDLHSLIYRLTN